MSGKVYLIGCGTGDTQLLTIKAYKTLSLLDVALVDHLVSDEIVQLLPKTTRVVDVGKKKGSHKKSQDETNEMMARFAKMGLVVGRLKSGDPYIFGRGAEEAMYLCEQDIEVEVIAGISSSIMAPQSIGIPVTQRDMSHGYSVVSAHLAGNALNLSWLPLLKLQKHTVVVLMGLSRAKQIVKAALNDGISADTPVAVVSNATRVDQQGVVTTLSQLPIIAATLPSPAVLIFGETVGLAYQLPIWSAKTQHLRFDMCVEG